MTMPGPQASDPTPDPVTLGADDALVTIDLTGNAGEPESTPAYLGRIVGGAVLMIVAGVAALALFALYVGGTFIPGFSDWADLLGELLLILAALAAGLAITGFEVMRRGRRKRSDAAIAGGAATMTLLPTTPPATPPAPPASSVPPKILN